MTGTDVSYKISIYDEEGSLRDTRMRDGGLISKSNDCYYGGLKKNIETLLREAGLEGCWSYSVHWKDVAGDKITIRNGEDFDEAHKKIIKEKPESAVIHLFVTAEKKNQF